MQFDADRALAANIATRVLAGGGDMMLVPYRLPGHMPIDVITHGLDQYGNLVVSCLAEDLPGLGPLDVRVDALVTSPQFHVTISAASTHALATVEWTEVDAGWATGVLDMESIHVHHIGRPATFNVDELRPLVLGIGEVDDDRVGAYDTVASLGVSTLHFLFDAASLSLIPNLSGELVPHRGCAHTRNQLFIVDVCSAGVTLLHTTDTTRETVHVALPRPARDLEDLAGQLAGLAAKASGWHADSRI